MSNRVVSLTFRHIIDDVIANVRQDFEDMGIEKEVLEELQRSWEAKLVATQVTEFDGASTSSQRASHPYTVTPGAPLLRTGGSAAQTDVKEEEKASISTSSTDAKPNDDDAAAGQKRKREAGDSSERAEKEAKMEESSAKEEDASKDEIGSDLDDSDDDDGDGTEDMILCLYDKVQRVKNKWKCVLRDGVASIDGRDYLFSKCNGEFEW
ncbi:transcription factor IIA subunit alpha [Malassezia pachydermatis]|uniref:Transcription initiation factor IIA large subunit n=1 Tax=Malassezia pachydermatis TaxID=77020 RepID=A0A0M8MX36_9BASI|nr:toa1-transcription factor tfiia-l [Malassezia pachydermatis]KOS15560.1 toa1-transcription factor tfiia-l [Malassezia pachydermatis]